MPALVKSTQAATSSILSSLQFSNAQPPTAASAQLDPVHRRRERFVAACQLQLDILKAEQENRTYSAMRKRYIVVKGDDGQPLLPIQKKMVEESSSRFRKWYFLCNDTYNLLPRFALHVIEIVKDQPAIVCGKKLADVEKVLGMLQNSAKLGELDKFLASVQVKREK